MQFGVRQGCNISPMAFLLSIDWIMRNTTSDKSSGIKWTLLSQLEDLYFAYDLAVLSSSPQNLHTTVGQRGEVKQLCQKDRP